MTDFLKSNRPDTGLVDKYSLSEIYAKDSELALLNIGLNKRSLDEIFELSVAGLSREDVRTVSGLRSSLINSLAITNNTARAVSFNSTFYISPDRQAGDSSLQSDSNDTFSDNIIVICGGIAADSISYQFVEKDGSIKTTSVSTSRLSLFNSIKNALGQFTSAEYPGVFRVRRRAHVSKINIKSTALMTKGVVTVSPTNYVPIPIYRRTNLDNNPVAKTLNCFAIKNSPLVLPIRPSGNVLTINFTRTDTSALSRAFIRGWELRRYSDNALIAEELVPEIPAAAASRVDTTVTINLQTPSRSVAVNTDCLLYIYLNPLFVKNIDLFNIGLKDFPGQRDIGLIGFDNLENLRVRYNQLTTLPVWLKTLHRKLRSLDMGLNAFWLPGNKFQTFDHQVVPSVSGASTLSPPNTTLVQYLAYSGVADTGPIAAYKLSGAYSAVQDKSGELYMNVRARSILGGTQPRTTEADGYRTFSALETLNLDHGVARLVNPDFSKIFPSLSSFSCSRYWGTDPYELWGLPPKFNNYGGPISVDMISHSDRVGGSLKYMGNTLEYDATASEDVKRQFIGQFKMTNFRVTNEILQGYSGGICCSDANDSVTMTLDGTQRYRHVINGTAAQAWDGWLQSLQYCELYRNDVAFKLAKGTSLEWKVLTFVSFSDSGAIARADKTYYNNGVAPNGQESLDILMAPVLTVVYMWYSGAWGRIFSLIGAPNLSVFVAGLNGWQPYVTTEGRRYVLPTNFINVNNKLTNFQLHHNAWFGDLEFRDDDFIFFTSVNTLVLQGNQYIGKFPRLQSPGVPCYVDINSQSFSDISNLGSDKTNRLQTLVAWNINGRGGTLMPVFQSTQVNSTLQIVYLHNSLPTTYPGGWADTALRGKPVISGTSTTPTLTWSSRNYNNTAAMLSNKIFASSVTVVLSSVILVGDNVLNAGGQIIAKVAQVSPYNDYFITTSPIDITAAVLSFSRAGQEICETPSSGARTTDYFSRHTALSTLVMPNCRISGEIPTFTGSTSLSNIDLSANVLTKYNRGTFETLLAPVNGTPSRLSNFNLQENILDVESVRNIIGDLYKVAVRNANSGMTGLNVNLRYTKYNPTTQTYADWTRSEVFYNTRVDEDGTQLIDDYETQFATFGSKGRFRAITLSIFP